jgi:hypothetical protein
MTGSPWKALTMIRRLLLLFVTVGVLSACDRPSTPASSGHPASSPASSGHSPSSPASSGHPYVGMWVTADGRIRQELLPDGRYEEERNGRKRAYTGAYTVTGDHIDYVDDTGFTADGTFVSPDVLHHGGMVMHRER